MNKRFDPYFKCKLKLITDLINKKIIETRSRKWQEFLKTLGPSPISTKPFWKRINRLRAKSDKGIPTLISCYIEYDTDEKKANLFSDNLYDTFNTNKNPNYDKNNLEIVDKFIRDKEFLKKSKKNCPVPLFTLKDDKQLRH